jgi:hypothetical protein
MGAASHPKHEGNRVPHLSDGLTVAKVGIERGETAFLHPKGTLKIPDNPLPTSVQRLIPDP